MLRKIFSSLLLKKQPTLLSPPAEAASLEADPWSAIEDYCVSHSRAAFMFLAHNMSNRSIRDPIVTEPVLLPSLEGEQVKRQAYVQFRHAETGDIVARVSAQERSDFSYCFLVEIGPKFLEEFKPQFTLHLRGKVEFKEFTTT